VRAQWETSSNASVETTSTLQLTQGTPRRDEPSDPPVYVHDRCWHCEPGFGETGDGCTALKHLGAIDDEIDEKQEELREHEVRAVPAPMRACANHTLPPCHDHRREGRRMPM